MDNFKFGMKIFTGVIALIHFAESWFSDSNTGAEKKELVMRGAKQLVETAEAVTTGGAKNTWSKIEKVLPDVVDKTASILYPPNK